MTWTCPFCPLLCDGFGVRVSPALELVGSDCARARRGLSQFKPTAASMLAAIDAQTSTLDAAVQAAARILASSRQPLFGGLATDVAGARALYRLAERSGAICDHANGRSLMQGLRALQDRGAFTTTLAEVRTRADLIVCLTGSPSAAYPEFFRRCGVGEDVVAARHVIFVAGPADAALSQMRGVTVEAIAADGDLFGILAELGALLEAPARQATQPTLAALARRLLDARYGVIAYDAASLPAHGELIIEQLNRIVVALNRSTRAAALPLAGSDGASTVNQAFAWLSGLPLRSRVGPRGIEHEPLLYDAARLIAERSVDSLLWISSFGPQPAPPDTDLPLVVLGHPAMAAPSRGVCIAVSTPGIGSAGHLFRTDAVVMMPLAALIEDGLPTVAEVVGRLVQAMGRP